MAGGCVLLVLALAFPLVPALDNGVGLRPPVTALSRPRRSLRPRVVVLASQSGPLTRPHLSHTD